MTFHGLPDRTTTVSPVIGALAACLLLSGCGTVGANDQGAGPSIDEAAAPKLPPGVLPPNDPPQPGDAKLGPDGHYDYSAPDFVLKNPCDMDIYQRALEKGWKAPDFGTKRRDEESLATCGLINDGGAALIINNTLNRRKIEELGYPITDHGVEQTSWYTFVSKGDLFDECTATADTSEGSLGVSLAIGGFSEMKTSEETCEYVSARYTELIRGE
ncbi:hypothetical protein ACFWGD_04070 [Corynebacterium sp. NPDC060344]|uniref:hypothetical protein n=1 Tax=Corynebacterium sp. NPDC060344 TaxID=3347101 RepID=UPI00365129B9